jgi:hypothetical protein
LLMPFALVVAASLTLAPVAQARGGRPGSGGQIQGADYSDPNGFVRIAATVKRGTYNFSFPRVQYNWYARSAKLCGQQFEPIYPEDPSAGYLTRTGSIFGKPAAKLRSSRFRWAGKRPRTNSVGTRIGYERIEIKGRRTGAKSARLSFTWRYTFLRRDGSRGATCIKVFKVKLSTKPYPPAPPAPDTPRAEDDSFSAETLRGDTAAGHFTRWTTNIDRNRGRGVWQIEVEFTVACGKYDAPFPFNTAKESVTSISAEVPIQGEQIEVPPTPVRPPAKGTIALSLTHFGPTTNRTGRIEGTGTYNVEFGDPCPGTRSGSERVEAFD